MPDVAFRDTDHTDQKYRRDVSLSGLARKNALKCALEEQRRTIFRRIELKQVREA